MSAAQIANNLLAIWLGDNAVLLTKLELDDQRLAYAQSGSFARWVLQRPASPAQAPELTPHQTGARRDYCGRDASIDPAMQ